MCVLIKGIVKSNVCTCFLACAAMLDRSGTFTYRCTLYVPKLRLYGVDLRMVNTLLFTDLRTTELLWQIAT